VKQDALQASNGIELLGLRTRSLVKEGVTREAQST